MTFLLVTIGWAIFRADSWDAMTSVLGAMFSHKHPMSGNAKVLTLLTPDVLFIYVVGCFLILFGGRKGGLNTLFERTWTRGSISVMLLILSCASITGNEFHPFIYFRF